MLAPMYRVARALNDSANLVEQLGRRDVPRYVSTSETLVLIQGIGSACILLLRGLRLP